MMWMVDKRERVNRLDVLESKHDVNKQKSRQTKQMDTSIGYRQYMGKEDYEND